MDFVPVISRARPTTRPASPSGRTSAPGRPDRGVQKPFPDDLGEGDKPIGILIVKSMLLTGFDAPIEQVLYIDRSLKEAELLQAVARVNRPAESKKCGYVVDYYGVANHLTEALKAYAAEDVDGVLHDLREEVAKLDSMRQQRRRSSRKRASTRPGTPSKRASCHWRKERGSTGSRPSSSGTSARSTSSSPSPSSARTCPTPRCTRRSRCGPGAATGSTAATSTRASTARRSGSSSTSICGRSASTRSCRRCR